VVLVILTTGFSVLVPWFLRDAVDGLRQEVTRASLLRYAGLILGSTAIAGAFSYLQRTTLIGASRLIEYDLRNDLFRHLQSLPASFYDRMRTGDLMARATNDLGSVRNVVGPGIMYFLSTAATLAATLAFMTRISPRLTVLALLPLPLLTLAVNRLGRIMRSRSERVQAQFAALSTRTQEDIAGIRVVKAYVHEEKEIAKFGALNEEYLSLNVSLARVRGLFYAAMSLLAGIAAAIVLYVGGRDVIAGRITLGGFVAFNGYLAMLTWPVIALGWIIGMIEQGSASMDRLNVLFDTAPEMRDGGRETARPIDGAIEFRGLTFSYGGRPALRDISLTVLPGTTLAVVGRTGSGKTTLVNLIARVYDPPPGTLFVDGVDVRSLPLASLRARIGFVPQDTFLFSDTLRENIAFAEPDAPEAEVMEAARQAHLLPDIEDLPRGIDTLVGERGITLSGGQKQRAAIARALLRNPAILILDDALSNVDTYTEAVILGHLRQACRGRTAIFISHRLSAVQHADQIVVLDDGLVVERGTHAELLELGGLYAQIHLRQQLAEELESVDG
jgi:ATP-binding cassette subfamily B protein